MVFRSQSPAVVTPICEPVLGAFYWRYSQLPCMLDSAATLLAPHLLAAFLVALVIALAWPDAGKTLQSWKVSLART